MALDWRYSLLLLAALFQGERTSADRAAATMSGISQYFVDGVQLRQQNSAGLRAARDAMEANGLHA